MGMNFKNSQWIEFLQKVSPTWTSYQVLLFGFASLVLLGSLLLYLPISLNSNVSINYIDALFTATSAVCVTGLTVTETAKTFSLFGQIVIIILIQFGGLGIMTISTLAFLILGRKIPFSDRLTIQDSLSSSSTSGIIKLIIYIIKFTFLIEFIGGTVLAFFFYPKYGIEAFYMGYWHAISAFCNAGFDIFGYGDSFAQYANHLGINLTLAALIILGGLGFLVIMDIRLKRKWIDLEAQTKLNLVVIAFLIFYGAIGIFLLEYAHFDTMGIENNFSKFLISFSQSVFSRTAGFSTIDLSHFSQTTLFVFVTLMFVGTAPGSTGGGVKTNTFGIIISALYALLRGNKDINVFQRRITLEIVYRSYALFTLAIFLIVASTAILIIFEPFSFLSMLFEVTSAFSTTGLSIGISPLLTDTGKVIFIILMFIGRIGIFTFLLSFSLRRKKGVYHYPVAKFKIG